MEHCILSCTRTMAGSLLRKSLNVLLTFYALFTLFTFDFGYFIEARPASDVQTDSDGMGYLTKFGWLTPQDPKTGALRSREEFKRAVKTFQRFANLNVTGILDKETKILMNTPRCGVMDNIGQSDQAKRRKKRYALQGSRWGKKDLSYKVIRYTRDLPRKDVDSELNAAFQVWAEVTPLSFTQLYYGKADIEIAFLDMDHGDGINFDGPEGTLAHAYFPVYGGDAHFDDGETWTVRSDKGTNLFHVAAHEFGHSLGLSHSDVRESLMAPFYRGYQPHFKLHTDDISAIQELYGSDKDGQTVETTTSVPGLPTTPPYIPPGAPDICMNPRVDAITQTQDGLTYAFMGKYYWRLNRQGYDRGYPRLIRWDWPGLPDNINTAFHMKHSGYTFFFKGGQYWKFWNHKPMENYPRKISWGFPGVPNDLDAAFVWTGNGKTYFIKGSQYWRYSHYRVDYGYPRPMSVWKGIPGKVNAAFQYKTSSGYRTYFFDGFEYYRFNDRLFKADHAYPRNVAEWWFGCQVETEKLISMSESGGRPKNRVHRIKTEDDTNQWVMAGMDSDSPDDISGATANHYSFMFISLLVLLSLKTSVFLSFP